jgi:alpha-soluble NSF attachment protein
VFGLPPKNAVSFSFTLEFLPAATCFKKNNAVDAVAAFQIAVLLLTDTGRLTQAAKLCKECAELYENDEVHMEGAQKSSTVLAIEQYEQAAELFGLEESKSQKSTCLAKVAELCSAALDPPDLTRAASIYDELGRNCLESNLLKFNAKGYFLQSILCHLGNSDAVGAEQALAKYEGIDYTFGESREGKFAASLVETVNGMDAEGFATACFEYDRISKLDPWKTSMLVKVKRSIQEEEHEDDDDVDLT